MLRAAHRGWTALVILGLTAPAPAAPGRPGSAPEVRRYLTGSLELSPERGSWEALRRKTEKVLAEEPTDPMVRLQPWYPVQRAVFHYRLGLMQLGGLGGSQSDYQAYSSIRKAAEANHGDAAYALGLMNQFGIGGPVDMDEARRWMKVARKWAEKGDRGWLAEHFPERPRPPPKPVPLPAGAEELGIELRVSAERAVEAARALERLGEKALPAAEDMAYRMWQCSIMSATPVVVEGQETLTRSLRRLGADAVPGILSAMSRIKVRLEVFVDLLVSLGPEAAAAVPDLLAIAKDPQEHPEVRRTSIEILGELGTNARRAVLPLLRLKRGEDKMLAEEAGMALEKIRR